MENRMMCGICGRPMIEGEFRLEQRSIDKGIYRSYPVAAWYKDNEKIAETALDRTLGFYCPECGAVAGIFMSTKPVGFVGRFNADLDDRIDQLPVKKCPDCGKVLEIDYPRCPECGFEFFGL